MRRVILAVTGTIAGLVALLSFKSHVPSIPAAATTGGSGGSSPRRPPRRRRAGRPPPSPESSRRARWPGKLSAGETAVDGNAANTAYGPVQIQLIERNSKIVKVAVLVQPANTLHDIQIGAFAFPKLIGETLAAQNGKIDAVSGASYTSAGYIQSLQSALDKRA